MIRTVRRILVAAAACSLISCTAITRIETIGPLSGNQKLVTLVVSESREVVAQWCLGPILEAVGSRPLGCQLTRPHSENQALQLTTIVRWTDTIPSIRTVEIEAHELCHLVATLQRIIDPCHIGNHGFVRP